MFSPKSARTRNILAIDLGGTKCSAAVVDRTGRILRSRTVPVDLSSWSAPVLQILQLGNELAAPKQPKEVFVGAGVAVPGMVRSNGTIWAPNLPSWNRMPLAERLKRGLGIPVFAESDRNAALLGECWRGRAQGKSDVIVLMIGTGIGAGILSGGRIVRGAHELSGCAGWLTVTGNELQERAVLVGELESLVAGPSIARAAQQRIDSGEESSLSHLDLSRITAREVAAAARNGDRLAIDVFTRAGRYLGYGIANMVSLFDPEIVILGGGMAGVADLYFEPMQNAMRERAQPLTAKQVKVIVTKLQDSANLLGCARLAWDSVRN